MKEKISLLLAGLVAGAVMTSFIPVQAHHGDDFRTLNRKVRALQAKTQLMNSDGFFLGPIVGAQVFSLCADDSTAVWEQVPVEGAEEIRYLYDCNTEATSRAQMRQYARHILRELKK